MIQILNNFTLTIMLVPLWFQFQPLFNFRLKSSPKKQVEETKMSPPRSPGADVTERLSYKRWQMSAGRNNSDSENQFWFYKLGVLLPCYLTAKELWNRGLKSKDDKNNKRARVKIDDKRSIWIDWKWALKTKCGPIIRNQETWSSLDETYTSHIYLL